MKKIIALVLILVVSTVLIQQKASDGPVSVNIHNNETDANWEYVKKRLFDNKRFTVDESLFRGKSQKPFKLEGPILLDIRGATKQDSLAIKETIATIKTILPHKTFSFLDSITNNIKGLYALDKYKEADVYYGQRYKGSSLRKILSESTIRVSFRNDYGFEANKYIDDVKYSDGTFISRSPYFDVVSNKNFRGVNSENLINISFKFSDTLSYKKRKQYIEYEILRTLCKITTNIRGHFDSTNNDKGIGVFEASNYFPTISTLNEKDTFLLQKLYADDFLAQFKTYLYKHYPWQYAFSFLDKELAVLKTWFLLITIGIVVLNLSMSLFHKKKFKYSFLSYFFPILIIYSYLANLSLTHQYILELNSIALQRGSISYLFFTVLIASLVSSLFLWGIEKNVIKKQFYFTFQLVFKVIFTMIAFIIPFIILVLIFYFSHGGFPERSKLTEFVVPLMVLFILALTRGFLLYLNHYSDNLIKEKDVELSRLKQVNAEAEVRLLQSQINPHFLYNALNSIASLALVDGEKTQKMTYSLSNLFKYTINRKEKKTSTIGDEIKMVQNYLDIEKIRFGDRLQFSIEVDKELEKVEIPLFIIQPLIENAIKHGISKIEGNGKIALKIEKREKEILITIIDNGPHFSEGLVNGHGLQTVYDLLYLSYGEKASLSWQNTPDKMIQIIIPLIA